ncbi:hypothetical protein JAB5_41090 [Janthinobacterium sp. HH103]|uniref:hypothetical protein n=1 Tax=unclassified Janthinobacterium TaxID=2610881 RepID=UPI00087457FA|nr:MULTISPECIES: hypothetical protein [unclassified Janthinobacterium]OEZ70027.1 hypothetical protein JAB2_10530 [Janthinobacterium sp. HH100]OEZ70979.1 hypothetical protein JAB5_41090 [Janthinobacterium sp. HH103]QOU74289.1 hypothetical protein JAB4_037520 [Janthinobacterium sp. HH102]
MYEDDKDKVRRNLVALSGFILVSAYLKLRLPNKIFDVELPKETNKIWVVVLIALAYAFWRFIHSDEARKARSSIASQYADCRLQVYNYLLFRDLKRIFLAKPPRWLNSLPIDARLEQERNSSQYQYVRLTALAPRNTRRWPHQGFEQRSGATAVEMEFAGLYTADRASTMFPASPNIEQQFLTTVGEQTFTFPRWIEFFVTLSAIIILLVRSEIIPEVLIPYGMAASAGVIALVRVLS